MQEALLRLGINVNDRDEMRALRDTLRWATEERARHAQRNADAEAETRERQRDVRARFYALAFGFAASLISAAATWLTAHGSIGFVR